MDYPRATDNFVKDLRRKIKAAKESVSYMEDSYKNADDPLAKSQILSGLTTAKAELKTLESNLSWYTSNPTDKDITQADSELALAQAKYDVAKAVLESLEIKPFRWIRAVVEWSSPIPRMAEVESLSQVHPWIRTVDPRWRS